MSSPSLKPPSIAWVVAVILSAWLGVCSPERFLGDVETFAKYPKWDACLNASISFEFRTRQRDALLMYTDDSGKYDYLQVAITDGAVRLWIKLDRDDQNGEIELGRNLNDGNWHHVEVKRNRMETRLMVDETQSSMVSLGSDLNLGDRLDKNNYVYFGGVPSTYRQNLLRLNIPASVLNTNFVGELRNILYFNCSCLPVRASMLEGRGLDPRYREACDTRNPCPRDCTCLSRDDGAVCECDFKRECIRDLYTHYHLPMDRLERDLILNPSGLDSRAYGGPELVPGVHGSALKLDGRSQWIRVTGPNHKDECFGDLDLCPRGYYVGFWVKFESAPDQKSIYLSNGGHSADGHGIALSYSKSGLEFVFKAKDGQEWRVKERDVLPGRWYHVAASWIADKGLFLYINGHQVAQERSPIRTEAARDSNPYKDFVIGRANDNVGIRQLTPVVFDDFSFSSSFKSEDEVREEGPAFQYYLPLNGIQGDQVEAVGTDAKLQGRVQLSPGKIKQAFTFTDRSGYITLGDAREKCLGDLEKCKQGIYISFFINFKQLDNNRGYIFSSPHGLEIFQTGSQLVAVAQRNRTVWEARYNGLNLRTWYFVEVSWSLQDGLSIYVDGRLVHKQEQESYTRERRSTRETQAFIGRDNEGGRREYLSGADLDEVSIFYDSRDVLSNIGFIRSGQPNYHHFNFENVRGNRLMHDKMNIELIGSHELTNGKVGKALRLNGNNEFANFGDHSLDCFGNLDLCPHGVLYSLWLRPERLRNKMYFLSTGDNGINLVYRGQKLHASASTSANQWEVSTSNIEADRWYYVEVSFHPLRGLALYINNELVAEDGKPRGRQTAPSSIAEYNRFYLGRGNLDMLDAKYAAATFDELEMWYADRDFLSAHGYVQRSRPQRFFIDFEELIDEDRLLHQVLPIRLVGRPGLIPGKVNNALELRGRGQYADLGRRGGECFNSLTECKHGITVAGWMRFNRFENNMVFLSTGENGILMLHRDGNIEVTADGRGRISIPRLETGRWYFVEITWHPDTGLELYVDNELRGKSGKEYVNPSNQGNFYIGQPNSGDVLADRYSTGNFDVDELEIWYGRREDLLAFGYINRDNLGYEAFSLDAADGRRVAHTKYIVLLVNGATITPGRLNNGVLINGQDQYIDLGAHFNRCMGNLDLCPHGLTLSAWYNPRQLKNGQTFFSAPTYKLFYDKDRLQSSFQGQQRSWTTSTTQLQTGQWQRVTLAWHPKKGLSMYINDELVDQDRQGVKGQQRDQPVSENIYIGRSLESDQNNGHFLVDEVQAWYDDLEQLRATGQYRVQVVPLRITFEDFRNNIIRIGSRDIRGQGDIRFFYGKGQDTTGLYLLGSTGYLDLGDNFTCGGNLASCQQGATLRIGLKPQELRDNMVFFDSFPIKIYYRDGKLFARLQTATQVWTVNTPDFRQGQWQRVELTWHPREGLALYIDGQRVASQTYPSDQARQVTTDWRTFFGRSLQGDKQSYVNAIVDNIEFWTAHRDYLPEDDYLKIEVYVPTRAPTTYRYPSTTKFGRITTQQPYIPVTADKSQKDSYIEIDGTYYIVLDLRTLVDPVYLQPTETEQMQFYFLANKPDGLVWLHYDNDRKMYLYLKDGQLYFVNDDRTKSPDVIVIGRRDGKRFDDRRWHLFKIDRKDRRINITIDGTHGEEYIFANNVQFLAPATVHFGGSENPYGDTGGRVVPNFNGVFSQMLYQKQINRGGFLNTLTLNINSKINENPTWTIVEGNTGSYITRPPPTPAPVTLAPRVTSFTIKDDRFSFVFAEKLQMQSGGSLSFKFSTVKREALVLYSSSNVYGKNFIALEIYDGKLYLVHNFGGQTKRTLLSESEVSDGKMHEVDIKFMSNQLVLSLDRVPIRVRIEADEELPRNLGEVYLGSFPNFDNLPWHTWARTGYQGCIQDFQINGQLIDFHRYFQSQTSIGYVEQGCAATPLQCSRLSPCVNGYCTNKWGGYHCDCRGTDFTGDRCEISAKIGAFNGGQKYKISIQPQQKNHIDDISFRFKTMVPDGFIFQTKARTDGAFIRAELDGGRVKIVTNLGGDLQTFYTGNNLNDMQWHTVYFQRRGNQVTLWVDDGNKQQIVLPGEGYHLYVNEIFIARYDKGEITYPPSITTNYTGYLRNFFFGDFDIFQQANTSITEIFFQEQNLPPLIFNTVTFPSNDAHVQLPALGSTAGLSLYFMFRTTNPNGVILFSEGKNKELFAVELHDGRLHLKLDIPGKPPLHMATPDNTRFNDDKWHHVSIRHQKISGQDQLNMAVDGVMSSYSYSGIDQLALQGLLYVGGLPDSLFQKQHVSEFLSSKTGYRGCLASATFGRESPDLFRIGQSNGILNTCQDVRSQCVKDFCKNGGICYDDLITGKPNCNCYKTAFTGPHCEDEPLGYYFRPQGLADLYGTLVYRYQAVEMKDNAVDDIVLGVMTEDKNAVLIKLISGLSSDTDFIEIKLVNGYPMVTYDTSGSGASTSITSDVFVSDGDYHVIRFVRTKDNGTLYVDRGVTMNTHATPHDIFHRLGKIFIGGVVQAGKIVGGTGFNGIIGGLYVNDQLIFPYAFENNRTNIIGDVIVAPHPFQLVPGMIVPPPTLGPVIDPIVTIQPPIKVIPFLPPDIGGGGIGWLGGAGTGGGSGAAGGGGVSVVVFPEGSGGSAGIIPGGFPGAGGGPVAAAQVAVVPSLPTSGPRAGAVMGTILGLAALASSLMWAFYRCKPGWCTCFKPPAGAPLNIVHRAGSNIGVVTAAGGGSAGSAGARVAVVNGVHTAGGVAGGAGGGGASAGGAGGSSAYYHSSQQSSSSGHQRTESYDSATLRATGTFSNKGTAIGTPKAGRHQFASSSGFESSAVGSSGVVTPSSVQSYHFDGGATHADYDVASGVHSNYQSNTLTAGSGGLAAGGGGYSSSTMSSNYNYSVKTIQTVGGQQQLLGYGAGSTSNVIVTPGAMGEEVRVDCCLITNDGHSVVTGSSLGPPQVWNMTNGELLRIMQGETVGSTNLHLTCNDRLLVGAINADLEINQYSSPKGVHNYVFQIWDFVTGQPLGMAGFETCSALAVLPDNDKVIFGRSDKFGGGTNIVVWSLLGNQAIKEMRYDAPVGNNDYISSLNLSQNGTYVIAGFVNTFDNFAEFVVFNMSLTSYNITEPNILRLDANPECTVTLPRDEAVTGLRNGDLVVWSLRTGQPNRQLLSNTGKHAHVREVKAVARSEDSKFLVSASADGTLKVWDLETERHIATMSGHNDEVWCTAISSDNEIVVSGSRDGTIRLWQLRTGKEICSFNAGVDVFYITMSRDKGTIVALGDKFGARKLIMLQVVRSKVKRQVLA